MSGEMMLNGAGMLVPKTLDDAERMCKILSESSLMPQDMRGKPGNVFVVLQTGAELGVPPMQAIRGIHVVKGRAVLAADMMVALIKRSSVCEWWRYVSGDAKHATFETLRKGDPEPTKYTFTVQMARAAGLSGGNWSKYPENMLRKRCQTNLARMVYPDVVLGMYDDDEGREIRGDVRRPEPEPERAAPSDGSVIDAEFVEGPTARDMLADAVRNSGHRGADVSDYLDSHGHPRMSELTDEQAASFGAWFTNGGGADAIAAWLKQRAAAEVPATSEPQTAAEFVDALRAEMGDALDMVQLDVWFAANGFADGHRSAEPAVYKAALEHILNGVQHARFVEPWGTSL